MTMTAFLQAIADDWLPTKLSRLITGLTMTLIAAGFYLPEGLALLQVQLSPTATLLTRCTAPLLIATLGLFSVLVCVVLHNRSSRLSSEQFTEHRGAFFKRKLGGGYHEAVYCGICKSPTATNSKVQFLDQPFICKCGWKSSFNLGDFNVFLPTLKP